MQDGCAYKGVSDMHKMAQPPSHLTLRQLIPQAHTQAALSAHTKTPRSTHKLICAHKQRQCRGSHWLTCHESISTYGSRQSVSEQRFPASRRPFRARDYLFVSAQLSSKKEGLPSLMSQSQHPNQPTSFFLCSSRKAPSSLSRCCSSWAIVRHSVVSVKQLNVV